MEHRFVCASKGCKQRQDLSADIPEEKAARWMERWGWSIHRGYALCPDHREHHARPTEEAIPPEATAAE